MILVVSREIVIPKPWTGIKTDGIEGFEKLVRENGRFKRRGDMETEPNYKQIIPYMVFRFENKYFLMKRSGAGTETRLHNCYSLGIGGHINEPDLEGETLMDWARREFDEEVDFSGKFTSRPLGLLNHDEGVGQVHLGYVLLLEGDNSQIQIKDEHQSGRLANLEEIKDNYSEMETWSQFVYDFLISITS